MEEGSAGRRWAPVRMLPWMKRVLGEVSVEVFCALAHATAKRIVAMERIRVTG